MLLALLLGGCAEGDGDSPSGTPTTATTAPATRSTTTVPATGTATLVAAGDIGDCASPGDEATADLVAAREGTVATLGDTVYDRGTPEEFARCYEPTWGPFKERTRPAPGNHDYATEGGAGYHGYFGPAAGQPGKGWYSYDLGAWHVVVLNSNCRKVSCAVGGEQHRWLEADLAAHPATCTLAYWHHPRFSSGLHGSESSVGPLYTTLYEAGADLVLAGHDHDYERFAPLNPSGRLDPVRGVRSFVVGTGGRSHYPFTSRLRGSEARTSETFGVLVLELAPTSYEWEFVAVPGRRFEDSGSGRCH